MWLDKDHTKSYIEGMKETNRKKKMQKKKIKGITVDVRSKNCLYITIGKWVVYIDNSTGEQIIDSWEEWKKNIDRVDIISYITLTVPGYEPL